MRRATCGWPPRELSIYSPEGKQLHLIEMHEVVSGLAFGEADMKTLFLTARGSRLPGASGQPVTRTTAATPSVRWSAWAR